MARARRTAPGSQRPRGNEEERPRTCRIAVYRARLERERYLTFPSREFDGPEDAVALFRRYVGIPDREHLVSIHLDARSRVSGIHTVSVGSLQRSEAGAREVFKAAILGSAAAIVLVHNHPSGDPSPSPEDVETAQGLELAGQLLGIPVIDHVIVGDPGFASLRTLDLLEFDPHIPIPIGAQNTDESWAAGLDSLSVGAAFLAGGMGAVRRQARRARKQQAGRGFLPAPGRTAILNPLVTIEPDPRLRPQELEPLLEELQRRIGSALERAVAGIAATVRVDDVGLSFAHHVPVFPMAAGARVFLDPAELTEIVDALAANSPLGGVIHDASGRAFRCSVATSFVRHTGSDRPVGEVFTLDESG